jgi:hypothetical protein
MVLHGMPPAGPQALYVATISAIVVMPIPSSILSGSGRWPGKAPAMNDGTLLLLLTPLIVIQLGLIVFALHDLIQPERRVKGDSKLMWGVIICLISLIGPILYLTVGREER